MIRLLAGDCRDVLATLPDESVQCVVTSPPYYGLRDYGTALWDGGDAACDHREVQAQNRPGRETPGGRGGTFPTTERGYRDTCGKCGAVRVDRQIGLERDPAEYLATMVGVFREVRRVLRRDGTCWVNMGDSYNANQGSGFNGNAGKPTASPKAYTGLAPKQLLLMPARLALALQAPQHYGPITKETDRAWLAALIDGEGTISIARNVSSRSNGHGELCQHGYTPFISIGNQDRELLDKCVAITGYGKVNVKDRPSVDPRGINMRRTYYGWRIDARQAIAVLRDVFPYLVAKRKQAVLAHTLDVSNLAGRSLRGNGPLPADEQAKRERLKVLCNAANQRQPVDMPTWAVEPPSNFEQGWWVRSDIIIAKKNPMPESCRDRPTSAHEHVFLLTKAPRYYFDQDAVRETSITNDLRRPYGSKGAWELDGRPVEQRHGGELRNVKIPGGWDRGDGAHGTIHRDGRTSAEYQDAVAKAGRNIRNVWDISTEAFSGAHFATMPTSVVERCIKAGTSERGCCAACGKPWGRVTEKRALSQLIKGDDVPEPDCWKGDMSRPRQRAEDGTFLPRTDEDRRDDPTLRKGARAAVTRMGDGWDVTTTGWSPGCKCDNVASNRMPDERQELRGRDSPQGVDRLVGAAGGAAAPAQPIPCTVLDPFAGAGTTLLVADRLQRDAVGIELNPEYLAMTQQRIESDAGLFANVEEDRLQNSDLPLVPSESDTVCTTLLDYLERATSSSDAELCDAH